VSERKKERERRRERERVRFSLSHRKRTQRNVKLMSNKMIFE
jgi:hypothetical protein